MTKFSISAVQVPGMDGLWVEIAVSLLELVGFKEGLRVVGTGYLVGGGMDGLWL